MRDEPDDDGATNARPSGYAPLLLTLVGLGTLLAVMIWPRPIPASEIRFCNITSEPLHDVITRTATFGDIAPHGCSPYHRLEQRMHGTIGFAANVGGVRVERWPEDYSDPPLPPGRYDYRIELTPAGLTTALAASAPARTAATDH